MSIKSKILIILVIIISKGVFSQYVEKEIIYDTPVHSEVVRSLEDKQQSIIVAGYSLGTASHYTGFLLKVSPDFDTTSILIANATADIYLTDMLITPGNNYFLIGGIGKDTGYYHQGDKIVVFIFDESLNMLSEKVYPMPEDYKYPELFLWQSATGSIYASGHENSSSMRLLLLKFDQSGDILLVNYPYVTGAFIYNILPKPDNLTGFYAFGQGFSIGMGRMEIDTNLNYSIEQMDDALFYPSGFQHDATARWLNDSVFLFSSLVNTDTIGTPYPYEDNVLIKIKDDLELTDEYITVGIPSRRDYGVPYNLDWKFTNKMYVGTFDAYAPLSQLRYFVALFNEDLEVMGTKIIGGEGNYSYSFWNMCATTDGGLICSGAVRKQGNPDYDWDIFVHKFMPEDIVQVAEKTADPYDSDYYVYPNPGADRLNIITARKGVNIAIYDQGGQLAETLKLKNAFNNTINTSRLERGIYFLRFTDKEGYTETIKWIKQ